MEGLLAEIPKLTVVHTCHLDSGRIMAAYVVNLTSARTVQGPSVSINTVKGVHIDGAIVTQASIATART